VRSRSNFEAQNRARAEQGLAPLEEVAGRVYQAAVQSLSMEDLLFLARDELQVSISPPLSLARLCFGLLALVSVWCHDETHSTLSLAFSRSLAPLYSYMYVHNKNVCAFVC